MRLEVIKQSRFFHIGETDRGTENETGTASEKDTPSGTKTDDGVHGADKVCAIPINGQPHYAGKTEQQSAFGERHQQEGSPIHPTVQV